jgi:hypothetical protein
MFGCSLFLLLAAGLQYSLIVFDVTLKMADGPEHVALFE